MRFPVEPGERRWRLFLLVFAAAFLCRMHAFAQEEDRSTSSPGEAGHSFQVGFELEEEYNDNLFLTARGKTFDYITRVSVPMVWENETARWRAALRYRPSYDHYVREAAESELRHRVSLSGEVTLARNLAFFELTDEYERVDLDTRRTTTDVSSFVGQSDRNTLTVHPYLRHRVGRTGLVEADYSYIQRLYFEAEGTDRQAHEARVSLSRGVGRRATGTLSYRYHRQLLEEDADLSNFEAHEASLGLRLRFTEQADLALRGGASFIDFDRSENESGYHFDGDLTFRHTATVTSTLSAVHEYSVDVRDGVFLRRRGEYAFHFGRRFSLTATGYYEKGEFLEVDRDDESFGATLDLSRPLGRKLVLGFSGDWRHSRYEPETEDLERWRVRANLDWTIRREAVLALSYQYTENDSSLPENDYRNNVVNLAFRSTF